MVLGVTVVSRRRHGRAPLHGRRHASDSESGLPSHGSATWEPFGQDVPGSALDLGLRVFRSELEELTSSLRASDYAPLRSLGEQFDATSPPRPPPAFVSSLRLRSADVALREEARGSAEAPPLVKALFFALCWSLDRLYENKPIQKFWVLETVARLPYFSYISVLHLYESIGWWRTPQLRKLHTAEEDNELHHLLIMESLGGNAEWFDRFLAKQSSVAYYWAIVLLFLVDPKLAYNFSQLVEEHAFVTYTEFIEANRDVLQQVPAPPIAVTYYDQGNLYKFERLQSDTNLTRPPCETLLDVFENIRDDELEHLYTMRACQSWWAGNGPSPLRQADQEVLCARQQWIDWSEKVNALKIDTLHSAQDG